MIPCLALVATVANAQGISLGAGRIAVVDPGVPASAVSTSKPSVADVLVVGPTSSVQSSAPPLVFVIGLSAGSTTVEVESAGGTRTWVVRVEPNGLVAPTGGPGLAPVGSMLSLPIGSGVLCTIPGGTTFTRIDEPFAQVHAFGNTRWFVQLDHPGTQDIAFEIARGRPRVLTLTPSAPGSAAPELPAGCVRPKETVSLVVGQEMDLAVGRKVKAILVGAPDLVYVAPVEGSPDRVHVKALEPGTTTVLARATDNEDPWMRTLVVARAP